MIPLPTTTVTISRDASGADPYEDATPATLASKIRAHIGSPSGAEQTVGGSQERVDAVLLCDVIAGLDHYCTVLDEVTADRWTVQWVRRRQGLGLDHMRAGLRAVTGASNG